MDYVYLKAKPEATSYDAFDKKVVAPLIIDLVERGALNYSGFKDGDRLPKIHVCAIVCSVQNVDPKEVSNLYDEIEAEKKSMASVKIADCSTQTAYVAELDKVKTHLDSAKYLAGVKLNSDCTTWTALKAIFPAVEEMTK